jgi:hypothetical protein
MESSSRFALLEAPDSGNKKVMHPHWFRGGRFPPVSDFVVQHGSEIEKTEMEVMLPVLFWPAICVGYPF